jgi:hypothetical protein
LPIWSAAEEQLGQPVFAGVLGAVGVEVEGPHEVMYDQLGPAFEEFEQAHLAVRTFEDVRLLDADHR